MSSAPSSVGSFAVVRFPPIAHVQSEAVRQLLSGLRRRAGRRCQRAAEGLLEKPCFSFELVGWSVGVVAHPARAVHLLRGSDGCSSPRNVRFRWCQLTAV